MSRSHSHVCQRCRQRFECDGEQAHNYDGWPEVLCAVYHLQDATLCVDCVQQMEAQWQADMDEQDTAEGSLR